MPAATATGYLSDDDRTANSSMMFCVSRARRDRLVVDLWECSVSDVDELAGQLDGGRLITDPDVMEAYRRDEAHLVTAGRPAAVLLADTAGDVAAALRWADRYRVPVVPRGSGSGLAGGATAIDGCLVLYTARVRAIRELVPEDRLAVVEAGLITADVDRAAAAAGLLYAPDPSSFEISTIGGNIATNAGGLRCVEYGVTRDSGLGLEVVWLTAGSSAPAAVR